MFGWGKKRVDATQLNARNPLCAEAFNPIFKRAFEGETGFNDQFLNSLCKDYEKHYAAAKLATDRGNQEQFKRIILSSSIDSFKQTARDKSIATSQYADNFGRTNTLGAVGNIVF